MAVKETSIQTSTESKNLLIKNLPIITYVEDSEQNQIFCTNYASEFLNKGIDKLENIVVDTKKLFSNEKEESEYIQRNKQVLTCEKSTTDELGNEHWYKITKKPIFDKGKKVIAILVTITNIDEEKIKETRQNMFLSTLAHDLKNVQQAQIRSLELINNGSFGPITEEQKEMLNMTLESSFFMKSLLYSVSNICRDNCGVIQIERTLFDINSLLKTCIKEVEQMGKEKNVKITLEETITKTIFYADRSLIRRVFQNMLNNIVNYAYENSIVKISISKIENNIVLTFENRSKSIPKELQEKIFEKYISSMKMKFNIGLGLYFCKKVINAHEGLIYVNSNDETNQFVIELPILDKSTATIKEISL